MESTRAGDSGLSGPETPVQAGNSGLLPGSLRTGHQYRTTLCSLGEGRRLRSGGPETPVRAETPHTSGDFVDEAQQAGDSGHKGPDTPASWRLRAPSGDTPEGYPVPHHILAKGRETQGPETPALADRRLRPGIDLQQINSTKSSLFGGRCLG